MERKFKLNFCDGKSHSINVHEYVNGSRQSNYCQTPIVGFSLLTDALSCWFLLNDMKLTK